MIGYTDTHTLNPDNIDTQGVSEEAFGIWLDLTRDEIATRGYNVATDESHMNTYVMDHRDSTPQSFLLSPQKLGRIQQTESFLSLIVNEPTSWISYSLDGHANVTITKNANLFGLHEGLHRIVFYAEDNAGYTGKSQEVLFSIKTSQPESEKGRLLSWLIARGILLARASKRENPRACAVSPPKTDATKSPCVSVLQYLNDAHFRSR